MTTKTPASVEWITLGLILGTMALWVLVTLWLAAHAPVLAVLAAGVLIAFHSSLQHEVIHGHPTPWRRLNEALVWPALGLVVPYARFRDSHLDHHLDSNLTDPFDDPESNFMDGGDWERLPRALKAVLRVNNTLLGRMAIGPLVGQLWFLASDLRAMRAGDARVLSGWLWHLPAMAVVLLWVQASPMSLWSYLIAVYIGNALLKIRTYAEHQAHELSRGRTVIIEDRGPLAFLFLNNNFHVVHHVHPGLPWYALPGRFMRDPGKYLRMNRGYRFGSYAQLFRRHLLRAKDPVPHPIWRRG